MGQDPERFQLIARRNFLRGIVLALCSWFFIEVDRRCSPTSFIPQRMEPLGRPELDITERIINLYGEVGISLYSQYYEVISEATLDGIQESTLEGFTNPPDKLSSVLFPTEVLQWEPQITALAKNIGVDPNFLAFIITAESSGQLNADSGSAAGLAQISYPNLVAYYNKINPSTPIRQRERDETYSDYNIYCINELKTNDFLDDYLNSPEKQFKVWEWYLTEFHTSNWNGLDITLSKLAEANFFQNDFVTKLVRWVISYNAGPGKYNAAWKELTPETQLYVKLAMRFLIDLHIIRQLEQDGYTPDQILQAYQNDPMGFFYNIFRSIPNTYWNIRPK